MRSMRLLAAATVLTAALAPAQQPHRNVILFVADGLRRDAVTQADMPTFWRIRHQGVDFANSHSLFPTFTTANASAIATGHYLGDTGDYSNVLYPGVWLSKPDPQAASGQISPFLENDDILADMNATFHGNYLGERTLLSVAREHGYEVASIGKLGPTAIQQVDSLGWNDLGILDAKGAIIIDDTTNANAGLSASSTGVPLPPDIVEAMTAQGLSPDAPTRTNGYGETTQASNGFSGDAQTAGTLRANFVQQQWYADVATEVLLPKFAASGKPFALLFWSRDPDGTQHNEGDSLQKLTPGINGPTVQQALRNVDHDLKQLMDWLDAHPDIKANTDVFLTSDHGFATISRRELAADSAMTGEPSANLTYDVPKEKPEPKGTLPTGFLAVDLAIRTNLRLFDPSIRATTGGSVYQEVTISDEKSQHPLQGNGLLGNIVTRVDGSDAKLIVAANGGSDLIYAPTHDTALVRKTVSTLLALDYISGVFVDTHFCPTKKDCPGALPLTSIGLEGSSEVPRPAIAVAFKHFYLEPGDLLTGKQVSDTSLQEGQGMHGGFGRDQTLNNMAAIGPDFRTSFSDIEPVSNADIVPTLAKIMGFTMPAKGKLTGRPATEALAKSSGIIEPRHHVELGDPGPEGKRTRLEFQEHDGRLYFDSACIVTDITTHCE